MALLSLLLLGSALCAEEEPRKIRVIGTGKAQSTPILRRWFSAEPSTEPLIIPTREWGGVTSDDINRLMRIYFPRTYGLLLTYDFYFLAQVEMGFFSPKQEMWMCDALRNSEMGALNTRSTMGTFDSEWRDSTLSDAFPNDVAAILSSPFYQQGKTGRLIIKEDKDLPNVMKPYKRHIEPLFGQYQAGSPTLITIPKPGSVILSYTINRVGLGHPVPGQMAHVFYWSWNRSVIFTTQDMVYNTFWTSAGSSQSNPYSLDIVANIVWFSTGRSLPEDPFLVHEFRVDLFHFGIRKSLLVSLLEFTEGFGANPVKEYAKLLEVEKLQREASESYLAGHFGGAHDTLESALGDLDGLEDEVARLKDRALLWVYVVEWSVTTSVLLVAGFILWGLMVRRSLYREVGVTRDSFVG